MALVLLLAWYLQLLLVVVEVRQIIIQRQRRVLVAVRVVVALVEQVQMPLQVLVEQQQVVKGLRVDQVLLAVWTLMAQAVAAVALVQSVLMRYQDKLVMVESD
jgi:hypothetical protein